MTGRTSSSRPLLSSLLRVEERLLESEYFIQCMSRQGGGAAFGYCLNAFLSSARSVTFLLQKQMRRVPGFDAWWVSQQELLSRDAAARFFLTLRNYSQKEGPISIAGHGRGRRWSYRFAGTAEAVPPELLQRDVTDCCREHLAKLAQIALNCLDRFPFHSCPQRAITPEGMKTLALSPAQLGAVLGFPASVFKAGADGIPYDQLLRLLREQVDGVDRRTLARLSRLKARKFRRSDDAGDILGEEFVAAVVAKLESDDGGVDVRAVVAEVLLAREGSTGKFPASETSNRRRKAGGTNE